MAHHGHHLRPRPQYEGARKAAGRSSRSAGTCTCSTATASSCPVRVVRDDGERRLADGRRRRQHGEDGALGVLPDGDPATPKLVHKSRLISYIGSNATHRCSGTQKLGRRVTAPVKGRCTSADRGRRAARMSPTRRRWRANIGRTGDGAWSSASSRATSAGLALRGAVQKFDHCRTTTCASRRIWGWSRPRPLRPGQTRAHRADRQVLDVRLAVVQRMRAGLPGRELLPSQHRAQPGRVQGVLRAQPRRRQAGRRRHRREQRERRQAARMSARRSLKPSAAPAPPSRSIAVLHVPCAERVRRRRRIMCERDAVRVDAENEVRQLA
jgi:hypothetical protein